MHLLYLGLVAAIMPILPRHWAPAAGLPQHSHPSALPSHSLFPFMNARETQARTHWPSAHTRTHTLAYTYARSGKQWCISKAVLWGGGWGKSYWIRVKMLQSFGCTRMQQSLHLLASFLCSAKCWLIRPFFLLMTNQSYMQDTPRFWLLYFHKHAPRQTQ